MERIFWASVSLVWVVMMIIFGWMMDGVAYVALNDVWYPTCGMSTGECSWVWEVSWAFLGLAVAVSVFGYFYSYWRMITCR